MITVGVTAFGANEDLKKQIDANLKALASLKMPVKYRAALAVALPPRVRVTAFEVPGDRVMIRGEAASFDAVSEFMRGLNNVVTTEHGQGRVVERRRDGSGVRVEVLASGEVLEFNHDEVQFVFSGLELTSTAAGPPVTFQLTMLPR